MKKIKKKLRRNYICRCSVSYSCEIDDPNSAIESLHYALQSLIFILVQAFVIQNIYGVKHSSLVESQKLTRIRQYISENTARKGIQPLRALIYTII